MTPKPTNLTCRRAIHADIAVVTDLLCVLFEMPRDELLEENEKHFADKAQAFFLAFDGDAAVGVAHGALRREYVNGTNEDLTGYLEAIYVVPEYRKRGVAAALVNITERWMRMNGCREAASDCCLDNIDSYRFHTKIGYAETERCIFFLKELAPINYEIIEIDDALRARVMPLLEGNWGSHLLAINGKLWDARELAGFAAVSEGEVLGYLLCEFHTGACEIMALHSIAENIGIASALIERVKQLAKASGTPRLIVQTSNDNTHAIRFYQRRGFTICQIRLNALEISRRLKPIIPMTGKDGIPLRDEIEFEMKI